MKTTNLNKPVESAGHAALPAQKIGTNNDTSELFQNHTELVQTSPKGNIIKRLGKKKLLILITTLAVILIGGGLVLAQFNNPDNEPITQQPATKEKAGNATQPAASDSSADDKAGQTTDGGSTPPSPTPQPSNGSSDDSNTGGGGSSGSGGTTTSSRIYDISYSNSCYSPANITIKKGDTVKFTNNSSSNMWPASNNHPSHTIYSEFDAESNISSGDTYSFTFTKIGAWGYHDHRKPSCSGTITVQ